ncbi:MAG: hypothetical protein Q9224_003282 [Gallowayella concinna]
MSTSFHRDITPAMGVKYSVWRIELSQIRIAQRSVVRERKLANSSDEHKTWQDTAPIRMLDGSARGVHCTSRVWIVELHPVEDYPDPAPHASTRPKSWAKI